MNFTNMALRFVKGKIRHLSCECSISVLLVKTLIPQYVLDWQRKLISLSLQSLAGSSYMYQDALHTSGKLIFCVKNTNKINSHNVNGGIILIPSQKNTTILQVCLLHQTKTSLTALLTHLKTHFQIGQKQNMWPEPLVFPLLQQSATLVW